MKLYEINYGLSWRRKKEKEVVKQEGEDKYGKEDRGASN